MILIYVEINFEDEEAFYIQLCNQIIHGIATSQIQEGDSLPSVRQMADEIGINMHTVNKAYSVLKQEGFITLDRKNGAVIAIDINKLQALSELRKNLTISLAKASCRNISREEVHALVEEILDAFES